jgi:hypothetical protein
MNKENIMGLLIEVIGFGLLMLGVAYWIRTAKPKPPKAAVPDAIIVDEINEGHPNDGDFS